MQAGFVRRETYFFWIATLNLLMRLSCPPYVARRTYSPPGEDRPDPLLAPFMRVFEPPPRGPLFPLSTSPPCGCYLTINFSLRPFTPVFDAFQLPWASRLLRFARPFLGGYEVPVMMIFNIRSYFGQISPYFFHQGFGCLLSSTGNLVVFSFSVSKESPVPLLQNCLFSLQHLPFTPPQFYQGNPAAVRLRFRQFPTPCDKIGPRLSFRRFLFTPHSLLFLSFVCFFPFSACFIFTAP